MKKDTVLTYFMPDMAKEVGIPAAVLYQELLWTNESEMAENYDEDGWFYYTADKFERRTTFKRNAYCDAIKKLESMSLIEKKKSYIKGTSRSVNHFRLLKYWQPDVAAANIAGCGPDQQPLYKGNNKDKKSESPETGHPDPSFSLLSESEQSERLPMGDPAEPAPATADPFAQPVDKADVFDLKPSKTQAEKDNDRAWAIVNKIVKKCRDHGLKVAEKHVKLHAVIKHQLFVAQRSEEDIMLALDKYLTTTDPFYSPAKRSVDSALSKDYIEVYLNMDYKPKQTPKSYTF